METSFPRRRHDAASMQKWLDRRRQEGLTWRELSKVSGIPVPTLQYWRQRLSPPAKPKHLSTFVEVTAPGDRGESGAYRIELSNGHRLSVEQGFSARELGVLLRLLQEC